ncbi:VWFA and cache domain-containing protein 1-like [Mytilus californianus]|uniref:VWFA and cache domain-containing protein 1-like n=1 Tax=Mytilus californianus TaxID=6549 RepID=UPI002247E93C|nr:VWFA and cache domain-containing protein 1-like [Mytilus californianus]
MKFLVLITFLHAAISVDEILNGQQLSDRLKEIKKGVGVDHMQEVYNNITFNPKSDDGNVLLQKIRSNISSSLSELKKSLDIVAKKVREEEAAFSNTSSLPQCCRSSASYQYDPKFRKKVDFNTACVVKSSLAGNEALYPPVQIGVTMKNKYENNTNILWQHYSTIEGTSIIYPATNWTNCRDFDPRLRPEFSATASPRPKDIVIVIASTKSMDAPSGVLNKEKLTVAKEAARSVINTLNPNDRVSAISFNSDVKSKDGCYSDTLAFATKQNKKTVKEFVGFDPDSQINYQNFEKALVAAFSYFKSSDNDSVSERDQLILFITDGKKTLGRDPVEVIRDENMQLQNRVVVFTYLLGPGSSDIAKNQLREMAQQIKSNTSYGAFRNGQYLYSESLKTLVIDMSTFYLHLRKPSADPIYTVPYVDPFSEIGLMTSMCRQVNITNGFNGVACTDVKVSELLKDVEYFEEGNSSYAFMIDRTGRTIVHPLLPDPTYLRTDPVLVDITTLERSPGSGSIMSDLKSGMSGNKTLPSVYFTIPRGNLINDGTSIRIVSATFFWSSVENTDFSICIVLGNEKYSAISEYKFPIITGDLEKVFMYHNRNLSDDSYPDCRFNARRVTLERTSIKFSPSVFLSPFQYTDKDQTAEDVSKYKRYFTTESDENPGFKNSVRPDVWATYELEKFWKRTKSSHLAWRYVGTISGVMRAYPGVLLEKTYDHKKRAWFRQTVAHPETMFVTPPYDDAWGSGILISLEHTIYKRNSKQVTAVVGTDFPLQYFSWFIDQVYPSCSLPEYRCIIIEDSGFIVMHPTFKESSNKTKFEKFNHITVEEPNLAAELEKELILNEQECQDIAEKKERRSFRVTLPNRSGLGFADTNDKFEIRPIPETNIFIIRHKNPSSLSTTGCVCDKNIKPNLRTCKPCEDCLCFNSITYHFCLNIYNIHSSNPCSASVPDTSGTSSRDNVTGLQTCFNPNCHEKDTKTKCFSEAECGWCEFTDEENELTPNCCRLKEDCSFGKTKSTNRDTCAVPHSPGSKNNPSDSSSTDTTAPIVGGLAALAAIIVTLASIGAVYCIRRHKLCDARYKDSDPYIDACHVDEGTGSGEFENDGMSFSGSSESSHYMTANPYQHPVPENNYTDTTFNHV